MGSVPPSSSLYFSPGKGVGSVDRPTFDIPVRTKPLRVPDAGARANRKVLEEKRYPSIAKASTAAAVAAAPAPPPPYHVYLPPCTFLLVEFEHPSRQEEGTICSPHGPILRIRFRQHIYRTISSSGHQGTCRRILPDVSGRPSPPSSRGVRSGDRGRPYAEEEEEEEEMGYWTIASIGRPEIVPPVRSGPGSSSGRRKGSSGGRDSLP